MYSKPSETKPTFNERIARLKNVAKRLHELGNMTFDYEGSMQDVAEDLRAAAEVVMTEAQHMDAASKKFAQKKMHTRFRATND